MCEGVGPVPVGGDERLGRARAALAQAEARAGVRDAARRSVEDRASAARTADPDVGRASAVPAGGGVWEVPAGAGPLLRAAVRVLPPEGWLGVVAVPDIGWAAAHAMGIDLGRVVCVPHPGPHAADAVAVLVDGVDVVCLGPMALSAPQRRRLAARARRGDRVLLTAEPWPGISRPWRETRREAV